MLRCDRLWGIVVGLSYVYCGGDSSLWMLFCPIFDVCWLYIDRCVLNHRCYRSHHRISVFGLNKRQSVPSMYVNSYSGIIPNHKYNCNLRAPVLFSAWSHVIHFDLCIWNTWPHNCVSWYFFKKKKDLLLFINTAAKPDPLLWPSMFCQGVKESCENIPEKGTNCPIDAKSCASHKASECHFTRKKVPSRDSARGWLWKPCFVCQALFAGGSWAKAFVICKQDRDRLCYGHHAIDTPLPCLMFPNQVHFLLQLKFLWICCVLSACVIFLLSYPNTRRVVWRVSCGSLSPLLSPTPKRHLWLQMLWRVKAERSVKSSQPSGFCKNLRSVQLAIVWKHEGVSMICTVLLKAFVRANTSVEPRWPPWMRRVGKTPLFSFRPAITLFRGWGSCLHNRRGIGDWATGVPFEWSHAPQPTCVMDPLKQGEEFTSELLSVSQDFSLIFCRLWSSVGIVCSHSVDWYVILSL